MSTEYYEKGRSMVSPTGPSPPHVVGEEKSRRNRTLGDWPSADRSKKPGSAVFTAWTHWELDTKSFARAASILVEW
jgi:hypothetical protein